MPTAKRSAVRLPHINLLNIFFAPQDEDQIRPGSNASVSRFFQQPTLPVVQTFRFYFLRGCNLRAGFPNSSACARVFQEN
jgi:hypothetical protein